MTCEHPGCSDTAVTICTHHCRLSICRQHRLEHDHDLLSSFEEQLDEITLPVANLLHHSQFELKQSEEHRQREIDRINHLCNQQLYSIEQRSNYAKLTADLINNKREQLNKSKNGDNILNRYDLEQIQIAYDKIQQNLQEQHRLTAQLRDQTGDLELWPVFEQRDGIECVELTDSEDETSNQGIDTTEKEMRNNDDEQEEDEPSSTQPQKNIEKLGTWDALHLRDVCPLTRLGVFGLQEKHNVPRLCSENNRRLYLHQHFRTTHRLKPRIASKLVSAMRAGRDPTTTRIFPQDDTLVVANNIDCPFDHNASNVNTKYAIPNTPCYSTLAPTSMRGHLRDMHYFNPLAMNKILNALKSNESIQNMNFENMLTNI